MFERGLTPFMKPSYEMWKYMMAEMPTPYPAISQQIIFASDWADFEKLKYKDILENERTASIEG